jgi:hypothetical protein
MKYHKLLFLISFLLNSCYTSLNNIPVSKYRNCVSLKINFNNKFLNTKLYFNTIDVIGINNEIIKGYSFDNDGYYYIFNLPPGEYNIVRAKATYYYPNVTINNKSGKDRTDECLYNFDQIFIDRTKFIINNNEFQFIGEYSCISNNVNNIKMSLFEDKYSTTAEIILTNSNTDFRSLKSNYEYIIEQFKDSIWQDIVIKKYNLLYIK